MFEIINKEIIRHDQPQLHNHHPPFDVVLLADDDDVSQVVVGNVGRPQRHHQVPNNRFNLSFYLFTSQ